MTSPQEISIIDIVDAPERAPRERPGAATRAQDTSAPLRFFRLDAHPFADSVNPDFFYRTDAHEAAFIAMRRCIEENISLGLTTALSGTGKTLLTQVLLQSLDLARHRPALVLIYPQMSRMALLGEICEELGVAITRRRVTTHELVSAIQQRIMNLYLQGVKPILIIDEAHFLAANNLQVLRTLSNIEVPQMKLLTILLFAEETFLKKLEQPTFKSILNRLFTRVRLRALTAREVEQYIKYRLLLVGGSPDLFEPTCYALLAERTGGVPREINRLCHNALQRAATQRRQSPIPPDLIEEEAALEAESDA